MLSFLLSNKKQKISLSNTFNQGISGGPSGKESTCQCRICRKCRLHSWVGKIPWRKKWQGSPVFLTIKSPGQRSLVGYIPRAREEPDKTERLSTALETRRQPHRWHRSWTRVCKLRNTRRQPQRRHRSRTGVCKLWGKPHCLRGKSVFYTVERLK